TNPGTKFQVVGNSRFGASSGKPYTYISDGGVSVDSGNFVIWSNADNSRQVGIGQAMPTGGATDDMLFSTWNGSSWSEKMRLTNSGNVGIGTTNPSAGTALDVENTGGTRAIYAAGSWTFGTGVSGHGYTGIEGVGSFAGVYGNGGTWGGYFVGNGYFSGNVGIGTASPSYKLQVEGGAGTAIYGRGDTYGVWGAGSYGVAANGTVYDFYAGSGNPSYFVGSVGVGVLSPLASLEVVGSSNKSSAKFGSLETQSFGVNNDWIADNLYYNGGWIYRAAGFGAFARFLNGGFEIQSAGTGAAGSAATVVRDFAVTQAGNVVVDGKLGIGYDPVGYSYKLMVNGQPAANGYTAFTNYSDARLKNNISYLADGYLGKILQLKPSTFNYNSLTGYDQETQNRTITGFIAQDVQKVFPDMVGKNPINGTEYLDTNLSALPIYIVKAIQEQQKIIDDKQAQLDAQQKEIDAIKTQLNALRK
nr:tail fiber domain-containing protein [Patescibacteria group bacterium]